MSDPYLQINNLKTHFPVEKGILFRKVTIPFSPGKWVFKLLIWR